MGGVDIGSVSDVAYGENAKDSRIFVKMSVVESEARRIRADSSATIESKGLLGDKMIVISVGSSGKPALPPGSEIRSETGDDMAAMIGKLGEISGKVDRVVGNLERTTNALADTKFTEDLKSSVSSLSHILGSVQRGEGYAGKLLSDPNEARRVSQTLSNLERVTAQLERTTASVNRVIARVESGPGLAHEVVYGEEGEKTVAQLGQAAEEVGLTLKGIREGEGLARGLLFGDGPSQQLSRDLAEVGDDMKAIVTDLRAGKGTLGALLVDPSIYEDLKLVLGNVQRNKALRALVRYSIRQEGGVPNVEDPDPAPKPEGANARTSAPRLSTGERSLDGSIEAGARASENGSD
jgi:phospholipid/cholesterol/gamma-HCH transport system substrate-binding protein